MKEKTKTNKEINEKKYGEMKERRQVRKRERKNKQANKRNSKIMIKSVSQALSKHVFYRFETCHFKQCKENHTKKLLAPSVCFFSHFSESKWLLSGVLKFNLCQQIKCPLQFLLKSLHSPSCKVVNTNHHHIIINLKNKTSRTTPT